MGNWFFVRPGNNLRARRLPLGWMVLLLLGGVIALAAWPAAMQTGTLSVSAMALLLVCLAAAVGVMLMIKPEGPAVRFRLADEAIRAELLQDAGIGVMLGDLQAGTSRWNLAFGALLGFGDRHEGTMADVLARLGPEDRALVEADFAGADPSGFVREVRLTDAAPEQWLMLRGRVTGAARQRRLTAICYDISERKRAEAVLRRHADETRAQLGELEALYANAPIGLAMMDRDLRFQRINTALAELNGLSVAEHVGRSVWDVVPALRATAEPIMREVLASGRPSQEVTITGETVSAPGVPRIWSERFYPIPNESGAVVGLGVVVEEVTERLKLERIAAERQARIERLLASNVVGIITVSNNLVLDANDMFLDLIGYSRADLEAGRIDWRKLTPPEYEPLDRKAMAELARDGSCQPFAKAYIRSDGERVPVMLGAIVYDLVPEPLYISYIVDMTDRERAEEAVRNSSAMLRNVLDNLVSFVAVLTLEGKVIEINRAPLAGMGFGRDELIGHDLWEAGPWFWSADAQADLRTVFASALSGVPARRDVATRTATGELLVLDFSMAAISDVDGKPTQVIASALDVTDRRRREDYVTMLLRELSHRSNNLLAVIGAIARQTVRKSPNLASFEERFTASVQSLASAQALLLQSDWQGAPLRDLVTAQLAHHGIEVSDNVAIDGADLLIQPDAAQPLALAFNELAADCVRHGALTRPEGRLAIGWIMADGHGGAPILRLTWSEQGAAPRETRRSIEESEAALRQVAPAAVLGSARHEAHEDGMSWTLDMPAAILVGRTSGAAA